MVSKTKKNEKDVFVCQECSLGYLDRVQAEKCEAWCKAHHTCNIELT